MILYDLLYFSPLRLAYLLIDGMIDTNRELYAFYDFIYDTLQFIVHSIHKL